MYTHVIKEADRDVTGYTLIICTFQAVLCHKFTLIVRRAPSQQKIIEFNTWFHSCHFCHCLAYPEESLFAHCLITTTSLKGANSTYHQNEQDTQQFVLMFSVWCLRVQLLYTKSSLQAGGLRMSMAHVHTCYKGGRQKTTGIHFFTIH